MWSDHMLKSYLRMCQQIYLILGELFNEQGQLYESEIPTDDRIS